MANQPEVWVSGDLMIALSNMSGSLAERALVGYVLVASRDRPVRLYTESIARRLGYNAGKMSAALDSLVDDMVLIRSTAGYYVNPDYRGWHKDRLADTVKRMASAPEPAPPRPQPEPTPTDRATDRLERRKELIRQLLSLEEDTI